MSTAAKRAEEAEQSLNGIGRAHPSPYLVSRIMIRLRETRMQNVPQRLVYAALSCLTLLAVLNVCLLVRTKKKEPSEKPGMELLARQYLSGDNFINYN